MEIRQPRVSAELFLIGDKSGIANKNLLEKFFSTRIVLAHLLLFKWKLQSIMKCVRSLDVEIS